MPLSITAHGVTSYFSETFYSNIAIMILRLSTDRPWQTVQTDIRLKAQFRPSLKYICTSNVYKGDSESLHVQCTHIYLCMLYIQAYIQHHTADMI